MRVFSLYLSVHNNIVRAINLIKGSNIQQAPESPSYPEHLTVLYLVNTIADTVSPDAILASHSTVPTASHVNLLQHLQGPAAQQLQQLIDLVHIMPPFSLLCFLSLARLVILDSVLFSKMTHDTKDPHQIRDTNTHRTAL